MKTEWNYTELADAYLKRPDYADSAIDQILELAGISAGDSVCDVGAGTGKLTLKLAERGLHVTAVEPNDAMRGHGINESKPFEHVQWHEGTGEDTRQADGRFKMVTFGSSFNVTDRQKTLKEVLRILVPQGWFACMWNHRDLNDPIQSKIEQIIKDALESYDYGTRREDQTAAIDESGLFGEVHQIDGTVLHQQSIEDCVEAWRSHATLSRQAGDKFYDIVNQIEEMLKGLNQDHIDIPYTTRVWTAQAN